MVHQDNNLFPWRDGSHSIALLVRFRFQQYNDVLAHAIDKSAFKNAREIQTTAYWLQARSPSDWNTAKLRFAFWVENWMANGKPKSQISDVESNC